MLYPKNVENKLGFDTIRELVKERCVSPLGQAFVEKIRFSDNYDLVKKLIGQTAEFKLILQLHSSFPEQNYIDLADELGSIEKEGSYLSEELFFDLKLSLNTILQIQDFFKGKDERYPLLVEMVNQTVSEELDLYDIVSQIDGVIDERGQVRDNASRELYDLRRRILAEQNAVRKTLERIYKTARNSGWIGEEMTLTVRNGRLVIPLLAEHKRKMKGIVHDESSTGQMAFVEPAEVLEANNEIRDLEIKERREVIRILKALTSEIRPYLSELKKSYFLLGLVDFIRAKAKLAIDLDATAPLLVNEKIIEWNRARHPILYLAHQKLKKPTVPLKVELNDENRILIVSGPNAGGKSVMLKTIGLNQYMAQCGFLVTMSPDSKLGIFGNLFIDIGDEQSIENDLSTYSSHLTNMNFFLSHMNKETLFLIDEFGTGTEPNLGGAIAESLLENFVKSKAKGVINTHYTNLKIFADKNRGLINGAMKFDAEQLEPLYELELGKPGSSFAIEVAGKIGLPDYITKRAQMKLGTQQVDFEKMLKELEIEKKVYAEKNARFNEQNQRLKQKLDQYTGLKDFLDTEQKRILNDAKAEAKKLLQDTNKRIENAIREIKENKAEKERTKELREELQQFETKQLKQEKVEEGPKWQKEEGKIEVGSFVKVKGQQTIGEVLSMKGKDAEVAIGQLKTNIKINRLEKVSKKAFKEATKESPKKKLGGLDMNEKMSNFNFNVDIRGKRAEEAMHALDSLMDDAIMLGHHELRIVHGKGDGILRNLVRTHLKSYKQVNKFEDEHADRGGHGVTIVKLT
ncbi:endonuclease MutS2 [Jiulongibacter sediminis]|uniref:Endonuclease MutS2 n=1 Tax=Jiulongibacter sediminis TaxID=1605367 RepID=A0A0P7BR76_9BACT|nr:Smr/MutS family protein [Jiulongibacter sediminis]KPM47576.1 DNA mismatch repair protein MutS [Jiulongibacter sediminis]TBX23369.1 DNA mismatch repair protein MutS [Jiulongibacter sediminis]